MTRRRSCPNPTCPRRRHPIRAATRQAHDDRDLKLFVLSFTAFFICFFTFLL